MGRGLVALLIAIPLIGSCTETLEVAKPPEACSLISDTVLHIGEMLRTEVCFEDDDVASLTYDVRSSDPRVISTTLGKPSVVIMQAVGVGSSRITVIATNISGLSASVIFTARVPNRDPEVCAEPDNVELYTGEMTDVTVCFMDKDNQDLILTVSSSASAVEVTPKETAVMIRATRPGEAVITVKATDPFDGSASVMFDVMVPNRAPEVRQKIPDMFLQWEDMYLNLDTYFKDPDGEKLVYMAESSDPKLFSARVDDWRLFVKPVAESDERAIITVTGTDPRGLFATTTFEVESQAGADTEWDDPSDLDSWDVRSEWIHERDQLPGYERAFAEVKDGLLYLIPSPNAKPNWQVGEVGVVRLLPVMDEGWTLQTSVGMSSRNPNAETCIAISTKTEDHYYSHIQLFIRFEDGTARWEVYIGIQGSGLFDPIWLRLLVDMDNNWPFSQWDLTPVEMSVENGILDIVAGEENDIDRSIDIVEYRIENEDYDIEWPPTEWPSQFSGVGLRNFPAYRFCGDPAPNGGVDRQDRSSVIVDYVRIIP